MVLEGGKGGVGQRGGGGGVSGEKHVGEGKV